MYYVHVQSSITNLIICVKATRCARNMTPLLCRLNYATVNVGKSSSCFHDVSNALCKEGFLICSRVGHAVKILNSVTKQDRASHSELYMYMLTDVTERG